MMDFIDINWLQLMHMMLKVVNSKGIGIIIIIHSHFIGIYIYIYIFYEYENYILKGYLYALMLKILESMY